MLRRAIVSTLAGLAAVAAGAGTVGYYRYPALHGDVLVFTAEGDLWRVDAGGGVAQRLTTHPGEETHAAISPDGTRVAFTAEYEGPDEAYVMPLDGGLPERLTFDGDSTQVVGWTPDGKVLVATRHLSTLPDVQLAAIDPTSRERTVLPLAEAADGCFDASGGSLFFTRLPFQGSHTKRYKGGTAQQIWRFDPGAHEAVPLTASYEGTSKAPMFWDGRVVFVSDRDGTMNLWSMARDGSDLRQLTHHKGWDAATPSLSAGRVVYKLGADLWRYDIATGRDEKLAITLASDLDQTREKWIDKPIGVLTAAHLSPDGDRIALTARGEVFVAPVKQGRLVTATRREGVRYRSARFLSASEVTALSDESGEVEWWRLPANGVGEARQVTRDATVLRFDGVPSPDGAWIASWDKNLVLTLIHVADGATRVLAASPHWGFGEVSWSPDSAWLAYVVPSANFFDRIKLVHVADGESVDLTDDRTESYAPVWSPDGKWIYFLSDRHLVSAVPSPWGPRQPEPFFASPTSLYAVALTKNERFPFAPHDELEPAASGAAEKAHPTKANGNAAKRGERGATKGAAAPATKTAVVVTIDPDGLAARLFEVPVPAGDYSDLAVNDKRLFWLAHTVGDEKDATLMGLEIGNLEPKPVKLLAGVRRFELSADGTKVLVRKGDTLAVFAASSKEVDLDESRVDLSGWSFSLSPREEWRQMFREAWRLERDYFYDRGMNGVDWPAMRAKYEPLVDRVADRAELSDILGQMISELSALHMFVYGGDFRTGRDDVTPASLGAVLAHDARSGGLRVVHVYRGDPDYPDELAPLARPGVDVRDGDLITMIDGVAASSAADAGELLRNRAGKQVLLHVVPGAGGAGRDVIVAPITPEKEADLRYTEWEITRRERVEKAGGGEIGYVHLRAMGGRDYTEWAKAFYPVYDRAGLIIDVRHNRGGNIDSWILEKLLRRAWFYWQPRAGRTDWNMQYAFRGHAVVLVDQRTASDGEAFAAGFRRLGLGKVIGMRTWGGEIWLSSSNVLVDKGIATAAETGVYGPEGEWLIEGRGVEPDIVVDDLPAATFRGEDAELDAAIRYLKELIAKKPVPVPPHPPYPDRAGRPRAE
jgi:tricorn protease